MNSTSNEVRQARRRFPWGLAILGVAIGLVLWLAIGRRHTLKAQTEQPVVVSSAAAAQSDVVVSIQALGAAQAWQGVTVRAQVNGRLQRVAVQEGAEVKAGDLIAEIDPAPYSALLTQAQGALERDQAQLALARQDLARYEQLEAENSIAVQQVDTERAQVKELEGTVLIDQGAVNSAQVNLAYCRITSPVTGRVGVRLVDAGNLVATTDTGGIIIINQIEPIAVTFSVPQGDFQRLSGLSDSFRHSLDTEAYSQETGELLASGELTVADNHVDSSTGTVELKARFPNADRKLLPGQFVNVRLTLSVLHNAISIPNTAVNRGPDQTFAYVIGADHRVSVRPITVVLVQDANAVIQDGLRPGESVVTDGQMSLKPGAKVIVGDEEGTVAAHPAAAPAATSKPAHAGAVAAPKPASRDAAASRPISSSTGRSNRATS